MAIFKDLIVSGVARFANTMKGIADRAIADQNGNNIVSTYTPKTNAIIATKQSSVSTATTGNWTAMCNSTSTGSPTLPVAGRWWNVISLDNFDYGPNNYVSQLALPTQDYDDQYNMYYRRNNASGTSINSSTWYKVANDRDLASASLSALSAKTSAWSFTLSYNNTSLSFTMYKLGGIFVFGTVTSGNFVTSAYNWSCPTPPSGWGSIWPSRPIFVYGMNNQYNSTANVERERIMEISSGMIRMHASYGAGFWGSFLYNV